MLSRLGVSRLLRGPASLTQAAANAQRGHHSSGQDQDWSGYARWSRAAVGAGGALLGVAAVAKAMNEEKMANPLVLKAERQLDAAEQEVLDKENR